MPLPTPRLDDRSFDDLVEEARARIPLYVPEWTDHNLSDPGITLIELFAWMTDIVLYRLNRVPDKNFIKFMELIGMKLHESEPARTNITFWLTQPQPDTITIPSGTEVATVRTENQAAIIFATDGALTIEAPKLAHIMTSFGGDERREFKVFNTQNVQNGYESFPVFMSETPSLDDAFYLGFENDISNHLLGIQMQVDTAEGAGIDPRNPPYVWEILSSGTSQTWQQIDVDEDTTLGLNVSGTIKLHLPQMRRAIRNDQNAFWIRGRLTSTSEGSRYRVSPRIQQLATESWGGSVGATNVTIVENEILGRSDGSPGQLFFLTHSPILARAVNEYLLVRMEDGREERWQEVTDFASSQPNDRHYTIDSDTGELRLGPAILQRDGHVARYGALAPKGALLIMTTYRYGGGLEGNVTANMLTVLKTSLPYVAKVTNRQAAHGGADAESLEAAKMRVPHYLRSLQRAVTASDFEYLAKEAAPGKIGRVHCLQPPLTNRGEIKLLVIPEIPRLQGFIAPESLELAADLQEELQRYLDDRRLLSTQLEITQPAYQWVETEVRIRASDHYDEEKVRQNVENRLFEFINPLIGANGTGWTFGRDLFLSDVMAVLSSVEGVSFVRSVKLFPVSYSNRLFSRGEETSEIRLPPQGVVVSYQHIVISE